MTDRVDLDVDVKQCSKCGMVKAHTEFYAEKRYNSDGLRACCKACHLRGQTRNRERAKQRAREYEARRDLTEKRAEARVYRGRHRAAIAARQRVRRATFPERTRAWDLVGKAVRSGRLTRPAACSRCGVQSSWIEASHDDYSRPLDVEWLCAPCHRSKDAAVRAALGASND